MVGVIDRKLDAVKIELKRGADEERMLRKKNGTSSTPSAASLSTASPRPSYRAHNPGQQPTQMQRYGSCSL